MAFQPPTINQIPCLPFKQLTIPLRLYDDMAAQDRLSWGLFLDALTITHRAAHTPGFLPLHVGVFGGAPILPRLS